MSVSVRFNTEIAESIEAAEGGIAKTVALARKAIEYGDERNSIVAAIYESYRETVADQIDMAVVILSLAIATVQLAEAQEAAAVTS